MNKNTMEFLFNLIKAEMSKMESFIPDTPEASKYFNDVRMQFINAMEAICEFAPADYTADTDDTLRIINLLAEKSKLEKKLKDAKAQELDLRIELFDLGAAIGNYDNQIKKYDSRIQLMQEMINSGQYSDSDMVTLSSMLEEFKSANADILAKMVEQQLNQSFLEEKITNLSEDINLMTKTMEEIDAQLSGSSVSETSVEKRSNAAADDQSELPEETPDSKTDEADELEDDFDDQDKLPEGTLDSKTDEADEDEAISAFDKMVNDLTSAITGSRIDGADELEDDFDDQDKLPEGTPDSKTDEADEADELEDDFDDQDKLPEETLDSKTDEADEFEDDFDDKKESSEGTPDSKIDGEDEFEDGIEDQSELPEGTLDSKTDEADEFEDGIEDQSELPERTPDSKAAKEDEFEDDFEDQSELPEAPTADKFDNEGYLRPAVIVRKVPDSVYRAQAEAANVAEAEQRVSLGL